MKLERAESQRRASVSSVLRRRRWGEIVTVEGWQWGLCDFHLSKTAKGSLLDDQPCVGEKVSSDGDLLALYNHSPSPPRDPDCGRSD